MLSAPHLVLQAPGNPQTGFQGSGFSYRHSDQLPGVSTRAPCSSSPPSPAWRCGDVSTLSMQAGKNLSLGKPRWDLCRKGPVPPTQLKHFFFAIPCNFCYKTATTKNHSLISGRPRGVFWELHGAHGGTRLLIINRGRPSQRETAPSQGDSGGGVEVTALIFSVGP